MVHPLRGGPHYPAGPEKINPQFPKLAPDVAAQLEQFKKLISEVDIKSLEEIKNSIEKE